MNGHPVFLRGSPGAGFAAQARPFGPASVAVVRPSVRVGCSADSSVGDDFVCSAASCFADTSSCPGRTRHPVRLVGSAAFAGGTRKDVSTAETITWIKVVMERPVEGGK